MFSNFYYIFRTLNIEGILHFALLSYLLYVLCGKKKMLLHSFTYVFGSSLVFSIILWLFILVFPITHTTILNTQGIPYWFTFISTILIEALFAYFFLDGSFSYKMTYILFFMAFIILSKVVFSPLYEVESFIDSQLYIKLDFIALVIQFLFLVLLALFFCKFTFHTTLRIPPKGIILAWYFPISILVCYSLSTNIRPLFRFTNPMIALIILSNLPFIYYILFFMVRSYDEQRRLDNALTQTHAQLSRFRFSIELQEQLKKERHELKNNYFYIQTLLKEQNYEQLNNYIENMIGEKLCSLDEIQTNNMLMDYLLNRKVKEAHKYQIKTYVEVLVPSQLNISEDTLCTILLNLLDNAIEASKKEKTPDIHIEINCAKNYLILKISNRNSINILKHNPHLKTTKKDYENHGLGLKIVRETVKRNNGIFKIKNDEGYFQTTVMLPILK